jgi:hypothetical protein
VTDIGNVAPPGAMSESGEDFRPGLLTPRLTAGYIRCMTTTRINHTGHDHPNTTAARTACRKAMKTTPEVAPEPRNVTTYGRGVVHAPNPHIATPYPLCRTGGQSNRGIRYRVTSAPVSCRNCR